jgi:Tol biopolymer transport system component
VLRVPFATRSPDNLKLSAQGGRLDGTVFTTKQRWSLGVSHASGQHVRPMRGARGTILVGILLTVGALSAASSGSSGNQSSGLLRNGLIVFTRNFPATGVEPETSHLYVISPRGGAARPLIPSSDTAEYGAAWSPDGSHLAFGRISGPSGSAVFKVAVASADGSNVREIANGDVDAWSPNGREIAFEDGSSQGFRVYVIRPDGSDLRPMSSSRLQWAGSADWSPDGRRIAFEAQRTTLSKSFIYVVGEDGVNERRLSPVSGSGPSWSPDGKFVAFSGGSDRYTKMLLARADGRKTRTLITRPTSSLSSIESINWAPNGKTIAFEGTTGEGNHAHYWIYVVRSDGRGLKRLRTGFGPHWSPDGRDLIFTTFYRRYDAFELVSPRGQFLRWIHFSTWNDNADSWQPLP